MLLGFLSNWRCYRLINAPAKFNNSLSEGVFVAPYFFSPLRYRHFYSVMSIKDVSGSVGSLLLCCSPLAIFRRIASIVVKPVYALFFGRPSAHVAYEVFKTMPRLTNRYAPATVVVIINSIRVCASLYHGAPNRVFRSPIPSVRGSFAAARFCFPRPEAPGDCKVSFTATTDTLCLVCAFPGFAAFPYSCQATKSLTNHNFNLNSMCYA